MYLDSTSFLPIGVKNILTSTGAWNLDENEWEERVGREETIALAVIGSFVNITELKKVENVPLLKDLIKKYVTAQLYLPLDYMEGMVEQGEMYMEQFQIIIQSIHDNQALKGLNQTEEYIPKAGIIIG